MNRLFVRASLAVAMAGSLSVGAARLAGQTPEPNTLTPAEKAAGWKLLFDGKTTAGWRGYRMPAIPGAWTVVNGTLTKSTNTEDILTTATYTDFELRIDWKIGFAGNSGIFYRAIEEYDHVYWSAPEYQLAEDSTPDNRDVMTAVGSVYGFYPSVRGVGKPAGQWNSTRIVVKGSHVEHWLNGTKLSEYELWSPDFTAKYHMNKFKDWPDFARAPTGFIGIQGDHNGELALRNIKIRELK